MNPNKIIRNFNVSFLVKYPVFWLKTETTKTRLEIRISNKIIQKVPLKNL
jgi:hypothetical protein